MSEGTTNEILRYLQQRLPDATVEVTKSGDMTTFTVHRKEYEYAAEMENDFLALPDALQKLEEWRLVEELCRAEGLRLVITSAGIRLSSSN